MDFKPHHGSDISVKRGGRKAGLERRISDSDYSSKMVLANPKILVLGRASTTMLIEEFNTGQK